METIQRVDARLKSLKEEHELRIPGSIATPANNESIRFNTNLRAALVRQELVKEIDKLKLAAKRRTKLLSKTSLHNGFYGIYQDLIDGRLPIDIDYFKSKFEVITEDGKALLVHKGTRHPASWRGKTNHHVTLNDYSQGVHRFRIYKTHRIVYAIHTGVDCVESDIGFIDGNVDNYHFSNLIYKG